jgi:hypothetical protein
MVPSFVTQVGKAQKPNAVTQITTEWGSGGTHGIGAGTATLPAKRVDDKFPYRGNSCGLVFIPSLTFASEVGVSYG